LRQPCQESHPNPHPCPIFIAYKAESDLDERNRLSDLLTSFERTVGIMTHRARVAAPGVKRGGANESPRVADMTSMRIVFPPDVATQIAGYASPRASAP